MAKVKISDYSTTAGNNTDINSINIAEGCAPSGINDAIRELMRQLKEFQTGGAGDSVNSGGDFSVATNKFTVASASGNTAVAGTLGVTGAATLSSTLAVTGTTTLTGALVANGNATLGDASGDTVTIKGTPTLEVNPTLSGGTANGVLYLNGSKVATSGSALTFDGTNLVNTSSSVGTPEIAITNSATSSGANARLRIKTGVNGATTLGDAFVQFTDSLNFNWSIGAGSSTSNALVFTQYFGLGSNELMRLTSSSLYTASGINVGIGTSSPQTRLEANQTGVGSVVIPIVAANQDTSSTGTGAGIGFVVDGVNDVIGAQVAGIRTGAAYHQSAMAMYTRDANGGGLLERARIDSAGNLGLGVTPSAVSTSDRVLQVRNFLFDDNTNGYGILRYNNYYNGTNDVYLNTGAVSAFQMQGNAFKWYQAASGTAGDAITFSQVMTLDASGNLGVGVTSASQRLDTVTSNNSATAAQLSVRNTYPGNNVAAGIAFGFNTISADPDVLASIYSVVTDRSARNADLRFYTALSGTNAERARIDSSGNFIHQVNGTAPTLSTNSTMSFELTSNTSLKIVVRGTDGTTRSATLVLV